MRVQAVYFSATGTTKKIAESMAAMIADILKIELCCPMDFTLKRARDQNATWTEQDIVVVGVPVYAGRVPNVLLPYLNTWKGGGAKVVCSVVYGNRDYDDALIELKDLLENNDFETIAACAFVGEHAFSKILGAGRPDQDDMRVTRHFAEDICKKIKKEICGEALMVKGEKPYRPYYRPKDENGQAIDIRKVRPKTKDSCMRCQTCQKICPMDSIDQEDPSKLAGICIKCGACIKACPVGAKYYDDHAYLRHQHELEAEFCHRKEPELFL